MASLARQFGSSPIDAVDAQIAALVAGAAGAVDRRATGTVYTSRDVCDLLAEQAIVAWVLDVAGNVDRSLPFRLGQWLASQPEEARRALLPAELTATAVDAHAGESPRDRGSRRADAHGRIARLASGAPIDGDAALTLGMRMVDLLAHAWRLLEPAAQAQVGGAIDGVRVLDPTCGAGEFLGAGVRVLARVRAIVHARGSMADVGPGGCSHVGPFDACALARNVFGVDRSAAAVAASRQRVVLEVARACGVDQTSCLEVIAESRVFEADALQTGALPAADVVLGNPPWVRIAPAELSTLDLRTAPAANAYAGVLERTLEAVTSCAGVVPPRIALALPISIASSDEAATVRDLLDERLAAGWMATFDCVPQSLFPGTVQRVALLQGRLRAHGDSGTVGTAWNVTRYHAWTSADGARTRMLRGLRYVAASPHRIGRAPGSIAKVGTPLEVDLLARLHRQPPLVRLLDDDPAGHNRVWYKRRWSYFLFFSDSVPDIFDASGERRLPSELKALDIDPTLDARVVLALLSSSLFHWWFTCYSDNRNVNRREILALPFARPTAAIAEQLVELADELMATMHANSELRQCTYSTGLTITNRYYAQGATKPVVDRIDAVLGHHYGLTRAQVEHLWWHDAARRGGAVAATQIVPAG